MAEGDGEAVGGVVRTGDLVQAEEPPHHLLHLVFVGTPGSGDGLFDLVRGVLGDPVPVPLGGEHG